MYSPPLNDKIDIGLEQNLIRHLIHGGQGEEEAAIYDGLFFCYELRIKSSK